ncbi:putative reverse transcriptase [Anopheles sinensis]|uniref:Putative reverse transcriptase n=1 Tax=Anopheles sinensis TaxID=74873 RepID=A0A084V9Z4_ANOSI|nr:putative reverse transcriptase [Anopheles sinensis]
MLLLLGDFNLPSLTWSTCDEQPFVHYTANPTSGPSSCFMDCLSSNGLFQLSNVHNSRDRQLDLDARQSSKAWFRCSLSTHTIQCSN